MVKKWECMKYNTLFMYALLNSEEIDQWEAKGFKCSAISTPHICIERQKKYLEEGNLLENIQLFDYSGYIYSSENYEHQLITLRRIRLLLGHLGLELKRLTLRQAKKVIEDPSILMMAERQRFGHKRVVDISYRIYVIANFWHSYLKGKKIDRVIFGEIPHHVDDFVLLKLTEILGIKTVCIQCGIMSRTFITDSKLNALEYKQYDVDDFNEIKIELHEAAASLDDWSRYLPSVDSTKGYRKRTGILDNYKELVQQNKYDEFIRIGGYYLKMMEDSSRNIREDKKYILYLMHMEPESAVYPMSTNCVTQSAVLDSLGLIFPDHQILIKEHPHMYSKELNRLIPWQNEHLQSTRSEINNIIDDCDSLMWTSPKKTTEELLANADALVCLNGSTGLMGVLSGVPTLVAKGSYLSGCEGTRNIDEVHTVDLIEIQNEINQSMEERIEKIALHLSKRLYKSHLITLDKKASSQMTTNKIVDDVKRAIENKG